MVRRSASSPVAYVKGAPDLPLRDCTAWVTRDGQITALTEEIRQQILSTNRQFASASPAGPRRGHSAIGHPAGRVYRHQLEHDLTFLGLVGMKDPIRPEAKAAVQTCRTAGIQTVMITGDHKDTAVAIAHDLGILRRCASDSGAELDQLSDDELEKRVAGIAVYAWVSAEHKLRVVKAWEATRRWSP
ncbi:MAG: HAD family hydrolase [Nitrospiraceae bacterium]